MGTLEETCEVLAGRRNRGCACVLLAVALWARFEEVRRQCIALCGSNGSA